MDPHHNQAHQGPYQGASPAPTTVPASSGYSGPVGGGFMHMQEQRLLLFAFIIIFFGGCLIFAGIVGCALGNYTAFVALAVGILIVVGGILLCRKARATRQQTQAAIINQAQHGPVVTGYTPVTGGGLIPPPGQAGPPGPTYNTGYQPPAGQPGSTYNPGYPPASAPGSGYNPGYPPASAPAQSDMSAPPPPSYESVTGEKTDEKPAP